MSDIVPCGDVPTRACTFCGEVLPATKEFFHGGRGPYGLACRCKKCIHKKKVIPDESVLWNETLPRKTCNKCGKEFPATTHFFFADSYKADGLGYQCKTCYKYGPKKVKNRPFPGVIEIPDGVQSKKCSRCQHVFPLTFEYFYYTYGQFRGACRWCESENNKPPAVIPTRICIRCKKEYPRTSEFFNPNERNRLHVRCKECQFKPYTPPPFSPYPGNMIILDGVETKRCIRCGGIFPKNTNYFFKRKDRPVGLVGKCKWCCRSKWLRPPALVLPPKDPNKKTCSRCRMEYPATTEFFQPNRGKKDGFHPWCKPCIKHVRKTDPRYRAAMQAGMENRRAKVAATPGKITNEQILYKLRRQRFRCYYAACGHAKFKKVKGKYVYHLDHVIPIARQDEQPRNDVNYTVLACPACNQSKSARLLSEWPEGGRLF